MRSSKIETTLVSDEEIQALNEAVRLFVERLYTKPVLAWAFIVQAFRKAFALYAREFMTYVRTSYKDESRYDQDDFRYWAHNAVATLRTRVAQVQALAPYEAFRLDRELARAKAQASEATAASKAWRPCTAAQEQGWDDCSGDQYLDDVERARKRVEALEILRNN